MTTHERRHATHSGSAGAGQDHGRRSRQLLGAIEAVRRRPVPPRAGADDGATAGSSRWMRIAVHKPAKRRPQGDKDVNIRVPIAIVRGGMRLGAIIPGLAGDQVARRRCASRASTSTSRSSTRPRSNGRS